MSYNSKNQICAAWMGKVIKLSDYFYMTMFMENFLSDALHKGEISLYSVDFHCYSDLGL